MSLLEGTAWDPRHRMRMGSFFFIFAGCSLALWGGCRDLKETWYSRSEPQELTAEQLVKDGPGGNLHVLVTDYTTSVDGVGNGDTAMYLVRPRVWQEGEPTIVLKASGGHPLFGVAVPEDGLQGMVRNGKHAFSVDQKIWLKRLGPIDFDKVWIIDHQRLPPPWWMFLTKVLGGLALIGLGVLLWRGAGSDD